MYTTDPTGRLPIWEFEAVEALAECWASIDGKLDEFRASNQTAVNGYRDGYMEDSRSMFERLCARGFTLCKTPSEPR